MDRTTGSCFTEVQHNLASTYIRMHLSKESFSFSLPVPGIAPLSCPLSCSVVVDETGTKANHTHLQRQPHDTCYWITTRVTYVQGYNTKHKKHPPHVYTVPVHVSHTHTQNSFKSKQSQLQECSNGVHAYPCVYVCACTSQGIGPE